ncbi:MAG: lipase family protein [Roseiarcus sp.]
MLSHHDLALLAAASYSGPQSVTVAFDVRADYLPRAGELVVVCPGTHPDDPLDWIRDLRALPSWIPSLGLLHSGFGKGGFTLWRDVREKLPPTGLVSYIGHSLGGALAEVLAGLHAHERPSQSFRMISFGAPRVASIGDWRFGPLVRRGVQSVEYQRAGDIVPSVPPRLFNKHPTRGESIGTAVPGLSVVANHSMTRYAADLAAMGL